MSVGLRGKGSQLVAGHRLLTDQHGSRLPQHFLAAAEDVRHAIMLGLDNSSYLGVNLARGGLAVTVFSVRLTCLQEKGLMFCAETHLAQMFTHSVGFHHTLSNTGGLEEIILRAGRN